VAASWDDGLPNQGVHESVKFEDMPSPDAKPPEPTGYRGGRAISSRLDVVFVAAYRQRERP
jgi:hypothetical protein